ncbi:MAG: hypothetical protein GQF41_3131 [Candidatus Rifleibacterium amylolyticum]|nr:MAG: hypothetical protein GQF41_3131 [Candidatus Rifleibacterium amylolyticum]
MGFLSSFKVMKVEDNGGDVVTFRTSRACVLLGALFIFAGIGIITQLLRGKLFFSLFEFCICCLAVSAGFILAGLVLVTYRKRVDIYRSQFKIALLESSILGVRSTACHFDEVLNVELARSSECIFTNTASLWVVKVFVRDGDGFAVERVFSSICAREAKLAAESIAFAAGKELVFSCMPEERLILSRV